MELSVSAEKKDQNFYKDGTGNHSKKSDARDSVTGMKVNNGTYANIASKKVMNILSLDFTLKEGFNISPSYMGSFCMDKLGLVKDEIMGVHRYGINQERSAGYIKIKMKKDIDVNQRFQDINGRAEDQNIIVKIRGFKFNDGMETWRILSPHEDLTMNQVESAIAKISENWVFSKAT